MRPTAWLTAAAALVLAAAASAQKPGPKVGEILTEYTKASLEGFTIFIHERVYLEDKLHKDLQPVDALRMQLVQLKQLIPEAQLKYLRNTKLWVQWDKRDEHNVRGIAVYRFGDRDTWERQGLLGDKVNAVEVLNLRTIATMKDARVGYPSNVLVHEFAHAWHHQFLGTDNPAIEAAYKQAMDRKLYHNVPAFNGQRTNAYAVTNFAEYFAEISEAYLYENDFYPFRKDELRDYDPVGYRVCQMAWGSIADAKRLGKENKSVEQMEKEAKSDKELEARALRRLEIARTYVADGKPEKAKPFLREVVKNYPTTKAARDARVLLGALGE